MSDTQWTPIAGCLFATARGRSWREEAATWLLAESIYARWPDQLDKAGFLEWEHPAADAPEEDSYSMAWVRWEVLSKALVRGTKAATSMHGNASELAVLRFACALMTGNGGDWGNDLPLLDEVQRHLVLSALAWAGGGQRAAHPFMREQPDPEPPTVRSHLHTVPD